MPESTIGRGREAIHEAASRLVLVAILVAGGAFRLYNVNWDKGTYHIHPDERHMAMVITAIQWPDSLAGYFDTGHSPLNPRNVNMVYFYGTLPLFLTKFVATALSPQGRPNAGAISFDEFVLSILAMVLSGLVVGFLVQSFRKDGSRRGRLWAMLPVILLFLLIAGGWLGVMRYAKSQGGLTGYNQIHLVGRVLSALFDLGSVLLLFYLARRLFDRRVGLLASALLALTVLNIQGSHYFAVDTFLTFFVLLTLWFTLDVAEGRGWPAYLAVGLGLGLTLACKVSVFLLVVVVALGAWLRVRQRVAAGQQLGDALTRAILGLILAAIVAVAVFRLAQPYAWAGPHYTDWDTLPEPWGERLRLFQQMPEPIRAVLMPNPQWIADIVSAGAQQTGEVDMPWGRQWTGRTPWLWPLENMVVWSLGVPLGVAAWLGVALVTWQLIQAWRRRAGKLLPGPRPLLLLPLAWVLLTFAWQGMQFVKSVRYFLPIHPYLAMFAAGLVVSAWDRAGKRGRGWRVAAGAVAGIVLFGTLAWALAFIQIYRHPVTRVQATRWMYDHIETAATLYYHTSDGQSGKLQLPLPAEHRYQENGEWLSTPFTPPHDLIADQVVMNNLTGADGPSQGAFEVRITAVEEDQAPIADAVLEATFGGDGGRRHLLDLPDVLLKGGQTYLFQSRPLRGAPLISQGSAIANEHFDDPLPFDMDGRIAFGSGPYRGLQLTLYDEDTPEKLENLLDLLDQADYICMSSGRLWQSIPRLPMRYPVTTRYYQLLFAGKLGFEKAAEFHSYPRLLGLEFDDTWAEEQFTVYDHPKVLIYRKTADYDRERVQALLTEGVEWDQIAYGLNPRDVPKWRREQERQAREAERYARHQDRWQRTIERTNGLLLTDEQRQVQEEGGTWVFLFNRNSFPNRWPTLSWLALLGVVGLAALPLTLAIFCRLPDRGYILARPLGVLLLSWLSWMLTNLTPLHYSRGTILLAWGLIASCSLASLLLPDQRRRLVEIWRTRKRLILANEALFLAFFALFWLIRWGNPDLWHPWMGGEKPMDFAYLNAVLKSTEFPPYDPWFAGGYLNYYYFGQVMVGTLIKLIGIVPNVAYNLAIPTWFAMTAMGAFSVTYNLVTRRAGNKAVLFGLVGALFVAVLGNLGEVHLLLLKAAEGVMTSFQSTIPGLVGLVRLVVGSFEVIFGGKALPIAINEWYWNASRAIPAAPYESVITEFPFFTFLYADLHAHLIAMPLTFLSLSVALAVVKGARDQRDFSSPIFCLLQLVTWGLTIGAMRTTNTWDVPPHLLVALGALVIGEVARRKRLSWRLVGAVAWQLGLLFLLSWRLLYWPFWASYAPIYTSIAVWTGSRTALWAYLVVHGLFLFLMVSYLFARTVSRRERDPLLRRLVLTFRYRHAADRLGRAAQVAGVRGLPVGRPVWVGLTALALIELVLLMPRLTGFTRANPEWVAQGAYAYRGLVVFALGLPLAVLGLLFLFRRGLEPEERLWTYLVLLGLAMSLGVEVIVLQGDIGRMNTVFKFYLQVWLMWGVAAAAALAWTSPRLGRWRSGQGGWVGMLTLLLACAALYPPLATSAKVRDRFDPGLGPGLDGWAYMQTAHYHDPNDAQYDLKWDLEAIRWLTENVIGSPVILEGNTVEYRWGSRYSINTGLPTVLGWNWHQRQQRGPIGDEEVRQRLADITTLYDTPFPLLAEELLRQYRVRYIIVGPLERAYYQPLGLAKFEEMAAEGTLRVVFRNEGVTIYERVGELGK